MPKTFEQVWTQTLDENTYRVIVWGDSESEDVGHLELVRVSDNYTIHEEEVPILYGAFFGPDIDDVRNWQGITITALEAFEETL